MPVATTNSVAGAASAEQRAAFEALLSGCGVCEVNDRALISITGNDRVRWLNGMVTNNVRDLQPGCGVYAFLLNPQGRILGDLYLYNRGQDLLCETDRSQLPRLIATFDHYIIMDEVEFADVSDKQRVISVAGPQGSQVLRNAGVEIPLLTSLQVADLNWHNKPLTIVRGDHTAIESFEVWVSDETESLIRALTESGAHRVQPETLELLRIASGIPRYGQDIHESDLPQETGQTRALHFSKGCYIGQEIVERIRSRGAVHRAFTGFHVDGELPAPGTKIQLDGKDVGEVTSSGLLPIGQTTIGVAIGYLRHDAAVTGKELLANGAQLSVAPLPFKEMFSRLN